MVSPSYPLPAPAPKTVLKLDSGDIHLISFLKINAISWKSYHICICIYLTIKYI